jgi:hypothetical protein
MRTEELAMRSFMSCLVLLLAACGAPPSSGRSVVELRGPAWVGDPAAGWDARAEPLVVRATGRAALAGDRRAAELAAESAARDTLRAFLDEAVANLAATFSSRNAGVLSPADLQAVTSDAPARQTLALAALAGARLQGQWSDDEAFYAWLSLDTGEHLLPVFEADLSARLGAQARELTAGDRLALRSALAALVAERQGS